MMKDKVGQEMCPGNINLHEHEFELKPFKKQKTSEIIMESPV